MSLEHNTHKMSTPFPPNPIEKPGYRLVFQDEFDAEDLNTDNWLPTYLPQWSSRARTTPRYSLKEGQLHLHIDADQTPWNEEHDGNIRVSNLQTGCFSGPVGSSRGQHPFREGLVVKEEQPRVQLYTPTYGYIEIRLKAVALAGYMSALWLIGFEETPDQSANIDIVEIRGENVGPESIIGYGVKAFNDPRATNDYFEDRLEIDASAFHIYAVDWTPEQIDFYIDNQKTRTVKQSIGYPMQLMLNVYELPNALTPASRNAPYPKTMVVDYVRGYEKR